MGPAVSMADDPPMRVLARALGPLHELAHQGLTASGLLITGRVEFDPLDDRVVPYECPVFVEVCQRAQTARSLLRVRGV